MKKLSLLFLACSMSFAVSSAFAQIQNSPALTDTIEKKYFPYAAACEDVKAQSQILLNLQHQLNQNPKQRAQILEDFWKRVELMGTPIIENYDEQHSRIVFLWKGAQHNVRLIGGPSIVKLLYYSYRIRKKLEITHRLSRSTILYAYV